MFRNMFGDPKPKGHLEIVEALDEKGLNPALCEATIEFAEDPSPFNGWCAIITGYSGEIDEEGDEFIEIHTLGYDSKDELIHDLQAANINNLSGDLS